MVTILSSLIVDVDIVERNISPNRSVFLEKNYSMEKMRVVVSFSILLFNFITAAHSGTLFSSQTDIKSEK
jgi:hypothetical protein